MRVQPSINRKMDDTEKVAAGRARFEALRAAKSKPAPPLPAKPEAQSHMEETLSMLEHQVGVSEELDAQLSGANARIAELESAAAVEWRSAPGAAAAAELREADARVAELEEEAQEMGIRMADVCFHRVVLASRADIFSTASFLWAFLACCTIPNSLACVGAFEFGPPSPADGFKWEIWHAVSGIYL